MTPLILFLLALAAVYVGTIETAFSALMRLSLRIMAERGGRAWEEALSAACGEVVRAFRQGHAVGLELPDRSLDARPGGGWRRTLLDTLAREPER